MTSLKSNLYHNLINIPGWRTRRKIVVLESDDWGSIRMPSYEVYLNFTSRGLRISGTDYNRFDSLESNEDLVLLFNVLQSVKDYQGSHPKMTANMVVGNPDFLKIKESEFTTYFYETVTETLRQYPQHDKVEELWKQGMTSGIFHPQFHGREHVNIVRWMDALRKKTPDIMFTFNNKTTFSGDNDYNFMEVLDYNSPNDLDIMKESLEIGLDLFEKIFGYKSKSFVPPCYIWNNEIEQTLNAKGVRYIQGLVIQFIPTGQFGKYRRKYHFLGSRNSFSQFFLQRNCFFEPSLFSNSDVIGDCLNRINTAFRWGKPAVICTHRLNFIGTINKQNRSTNLRLFQELLNRIIKLWPNVEFMTSDQLGELIENRK